ncbi:uncharacterized protein LOC143768328 [Ranitomeya variabilis]|uniref:uncharacterized protein LOC143768328 n=1 Tax=Ranitomeya variabilis TaxID=490064 RepID=UPI0040563E78
MSVGIVETTLTILIVWMPACITAIVIASIYFNRCPGMPYLPYNVILQALALMSLLPAVYKFKRSGTKKTKHAAISSGIVSIGFHIAGCVIVSFRDSYYSQCHNVLLICEMYFTIVNCGVAALVCLCLLIVFLVKCFSSSSDPAPADNA